MITGSEKAFAAGADIKEMQNCPIMEAHRLDCSFGGIMLRAAAQADHRGGLRLCARRRLRTSR